MSPKDLKVHNKSICIIIAQDWKQSTCPQVNGQTVIHSCNGVLLSNEKEGAVDTCNNMDECQNKLNERSQMHSERKAFIYMKF